MYPHFMEDKTFDTFSWRLNTQMFRNKKKKKLQTILFLCRLYCIFSVNHILTFCDHSGWQKPHPSLTCWVKVIVCAWGKKNIRARLCMIQGCPLFLNVQARLFMEGKGYLINYHSNFFESNRHSVETLMSILRLVKINVSRRIIPH